MEIRNNTQNVAFKQNILAYSTKKSLNDVGDTLSKVVSWASRAEDLPLYGEPMEISMPPTLFGAPKNIWLVPDKNTPLGKVLSVIIDKLKSTRANIVKYIPCDAEDGIGHIVADVFSPNCKPVNTDKSGNKVKTALDKVLSLIKSEYKKSQTSDESASDAVQNLFDRVVDLLVKDKKEIIPVNLDEPMPVI